MGDYNLWISSSPPGDEKEVLGIHYSMFPALFVKSIEFFENRFRLAKKVYFLGQPLKKFLRSIIC